MNGARLFSKQSLFVESVNNPWAPTCVRLGRQLPSWNLWNDEVGKWEKRARLLKGARNGDGGFQTE
jgi:hypothetical protein